ncbi:MAG: hypothetical protein L3K18_02305 [Thermoplasmata archaeon]|nr:hypothetical protein [Thermoplasmata archaeon]MCI4355963.1 hypothetical protein [Thermoplasmata archaeon]
MRLDPPCGPRRKILGGTIAASALALLVLFSPFSQAAPVHAPVVYTAPFSGKVGVATYLQTVDCKVTGAFTKAPGFTRATGLEQLSEKATARACPSALSYGYETVTGDAALWTKPFHVASGLYHVVVKWRVTWSAKLVANLGPTSSGLAHASSFLVGVVYLYDASNLTYLPGSNSWGAFNITYNGTVTLHSSALVTLYLNQTVRAGDTYNIATWIDASASAWAASFGHSSASASVNLGTVGNGAKLLSITRS